ncbi:hypothetical protein HanIR_Chr17g0861411 [Helianthus annuus]|nr:hypothetical protein HanIR_Chr17g0861411 [Helianthus annuus]
MPVVRFAGDDVVCGFKLFSFLHLLCVQLREAQSNQPSLSPLDHRPKHKLSPTRFLRPGYPTGHRLLSHQHRWPRFWRKAAETR